MTTEEKRLLLNDLCARLPYGFTIYRHSDNANIKINDIDEFAHFLEYSDGEEFKPYLRPMSSMTEEERSEYNELREDIEAKLKDWKCADFMEWIYLHNLDYRGLIEKGLALEAPEGMYA